MHITSTLRGGIEPPGPSTQINGYNHWTSPLAVKSSKKSNNQTGFFPFCNWHSLQLTWQIYFGSMAVSSFILDPLAVSSCIKLYAKKTQSIFLFLTTFGCFSTLLIFWETVMQLGGNKNKPVCWWLLFIFLHLTQDVVGVGEATLGWQLIVFNCYFYL